MAWNDAKVTKAGTDMLNELLAGRTLTITAAYGGTEVVESAALENQADVSGDKHRLSVMGVTNAEEGKTVKVQVANQGVTTAYTMKQVGVFAILDRGLPTETEERLLFIMQDTRGADVPTQADNPMFTLDMYCIIRISNDVQFQVTVDAAGIVTIDFLADELADHNADPAAHPDLRAAIAQVAAGGGAPAYSDTETYAAGDYCTKDDKLYKCIADISSPEAWTEAHWEETKITDELAEAQRTAQAGIAALAAPYSATDTYAVGAYCTHDGKLYRCTTAITAAEEWTPGHWEQTTSGAQMASLAAGVADAKATANAAAAAAESAEAATGRLPVIRDGTWWVWNAAEGAYVDTGTIATPVLGVDYFTDADREQMVTEVADALRDGALVGFVDEDNNIVLSGNIADGFYYLKYEMADGTVADVGTINVGDVPEPVPAYTNLIPTALGLDFETVYNGTGYKENSRYSISAGGDVSGPGLVTTGFIELTNRETDVFHFRGVDAQASGNAPVRWTSDGTAHHLESTSTKIPEAAFGTDENGDLTVWFGYVGGIPSTARYIRFTMQRTSGELIVTRNELITDT